MRSAAGSRGHLSTPPPRLPAILQLQLRPPNLLRPKLWQASPPLGSSAHLGYAPGRCTWDSAASPAALLPPFLLFPQLAPLALPPPAATSPLTAPNPGQTAPRLQQATRARHSQLIPEDSAVTG